MKGSLFIHGQFCWNSLRLLFGVDYVGEQDLGADFTGDALESCFVYFGEYHVIRFEEKEFESQ